MHNSVFATITWGSRVRLVRPPTQPHPEPDGTEATVLYPDLNANQVMVVVDGLNFPSPIHFTDLEAVSIAPKRPLDDLIQQFLLAGQDHAALWIAAGQWFQFPPGNQLLNAPAQTQVITQFEGSAHALRNSQAIS